MPEKVTTAALAAALALLAPPALAQDATKACIAASDSAQKLRDDHKLLQAREQFLLCAKESCHSAIRQDCADALAELAKKIPSVVVRAKDKSGADAINVSVSIDGAAVTSTLDGKAIPLDPGVHTFKLEMGGDALEKQVVIAEGEQSRLLAFSFAPGGAPATGEPPATGEKKRGFPIVPTVVAGIGVLAFGSFALFGLMGTSEFNDAKKTCGPMSPMGGCTNDKIDSIRTKLVVADVSLGIGIAAAVGATVLYILHFTGGSSADSRKAAVGVAPVPGGAHASFGMQF